MPKLLDPACLRFSLLGALFCLAFPISPLRAQCPDFDAIGFDYVMSVAGRPFRASLVQTVVTYASDDSKVTTVTKENLFRDNKGRIRIERFYDGSDHPNDATPSQILLYDNCGTHVGLLPASRTAKITTMSPPVNHNPSRDPYCKELDPEHLPWVGPEGTFENLGHKIISGIEARGWRDTHYASVQAKQSGAPPVSISESWCSLELENAMDSYTLTDRPKMEVTNEIREITREEPDPDLFEIPKDYKVTRVEKLGNAPTARPAAPATDHPR